MTVVPVDTMEISWGTFWAVTVMPAPSVVTVVRSSTTVMTTVVKTGGDNQW